MTHDRIYRTATRFERAIEEIEHGAGSRFDPHMASQFVGILKRLKSVHGSGLDKHLAAAADESSFMRARRNIANALIR